ncbi:MAG: divergent polysaccharide deacetylase family protein [Synergistaceae bacterium]|nr:divergent polysaccharide deacetylase family protein [Synergistaceae bacterium]
MAPSSRPRKRAATLFWIAALVMVFVGGILIGASLNRDPATEPEVPALDEDQAVVGAEMTEPTPLFFEAEGERSSDGYGALSIDVEPDRDDESGPDEASVTSGRPRLLKPPAGEGLICLVIDDCGFNVDYPRRLTNLAIPMTFAILPRERSSLEVASLLRERGYPAILHLPMEAERDGPNGPYLVGLAMDDEKISRTVATLLDEMPSLIGVNNHRGSRATSDERVMAAVLRPIAERGLVFVDSRTSSRSVAFRKAREMGVKAAYNSVFLDHEADHGFMARQWERAQDLAQRRGWVVVIGHVRPKTITFFETVDLNLREGVRLVTLPELLEAIHPK